MTTIEQPSIAFRMDAYPIDRDLIVNRPSFAGAMELAISLCNFENDKQAASRLDIDAALYSKRKNGQAEWQMPDVRRVMERGQNLIPLAWLANQYGHGLVMLETEAERQNRELREQLDAERLKNRVLVDALHGRV